jgi:hypothetical protein
MMSGHVGRTLSTWLIACRWKMGRASPFTNNIDWPDIQASCQDDQIDAVNQLTVFPGGGR